MSDYSGELNPRGELDRLADRSRPGLARLLGELVLKIAPEFHRNEQRQGFAPEIAGMLSRLMREVGGDKDVDVTDVAIGLADICIQIDALSRVGAFCPVVQLGEDWIPLLLRPGSKRAAALSAVVVDRFGVVQPLPFALAPSKYAAQLMVQPLSGFMAMRWLFGGSASGNVEVSNTANGWDIVYSPPHVAVPYAFGGPSTPVTNHLNPGNYHFGIDNGTTTTWDSKIWPIPPTVTAVPPHKVHIPKP